MNILSIRTKSEWILLISLLFLSFTGFYGGYSLITEPSGTTIKMSFVVEQYAALGNMLFPGLLLFLTLGVTPLIIFYFVWNKYVFTWRASSFIGLLVVFVTFVMIKLFGYATIPFIQMVYGLLGLIIITVTLFFKPKYYS